MNADAVADWIKAEIARDPRLALLVMVDHLLEAGSPHALPRDELASWVVVLVDDARLDPRRLGDDPHLEGVGAHLYRGVIDVASARVLEARDVLRDDPYLDALSPPG